jgi:hypothetical protein
VGSMMQKAMELKQKKNLDHIKGNLFASLSYDYLNQLATYVGIDIGLDEGDKGRLIDNLVNSNKDQYDHFVSENPKVLLPENLDTKLNCDEGPIEGQLVMAPKNTPTVSMKESDTVEHWSEVVKRDRRNNKTRRRSDKIVPNERGILEY